MLMLSTSIVLAGPRAEQVQLLKGYTALATPPNPMPMTSTCATLADETVNDLIYEDISARVDAQQSAVRRKRTHQAAATNTLHERRLEARTLQTIIGEDESRLRAYTDAAEAAERQ